MTTILNEEKNRNIYWIVFSVYSLAVLFGVINHEPWGDEAQAWLIARDNTIAGIFKTLPAEGHPPLWYLILYPFAQAGVPHHILDFISGGVMIAAVYLLLFKTKVNPLLKLALPFSYFFFYEYAIVGRNYCFYVFFITAIIALYDKRFEKPLLFALCVVGLYNSHVLVFTFAFGIMMLFLWDGMQQKKLNGSVLGSFVLMCIGGLYLIPYLFMSSMVRFYQTKILDHADLAKTAITNGLSLTGNPLFLLLFIVLIVLLAQRTKPLMLLLLGLAGTLYIISFRYATTTRHHGVLFIIIFGAYGIASYYKDDALNGLKNVQQDLYKFGIWAICIAVAAQLPSTLKKYSDDITTLNSDAKDAAEFLMDRKDKHETIVGYEATSVLSLLPYMPKGSQFYYAECQRYGSFYVYDSCFMKEIWAYPVDYAVKVSHDNFKDLNKVVLLLNYPVQPQSEKYLDLIYKTEEPVLHWEEAFYIYKFKPNVK